MVTTCHDKNSSRIESIASKAEPLHKLVQGEFGEKATYHINGRIYYISDLPNCVVSAAGYIIESYLKLKDDNQR